MPLSPEQYEERLADLDDTIARVEPYDVEFVVMGDPKPVVHAINDLTRAVLAVAKGVRLLVEPPPVEVAEAPRGTFTVVDRDDDEEK